MNLSQALRLIRASGVELVQKGDGFAVRGGAAERESVKPAILEHRAEIVTRIRAGTLACKSCKRVVDERFVCWTCQNRPCESCGRPTGSPFIANCDPCALGVN